VLVDDETLATVKEAVGTLDWTVALLTFGKVIDNEVKVEDLLKDDGSGDDLIFISMHSMY